MSFLCPNCGAEVESTAMACPECGSDERTGWSEETIYDGLDLPEDAFEENSSSSSKSPRNDLLLAGIALVVLILFVLGFVF